MVKVRHGEKEEKKKKRKKKTVDLYKSKSSKNEAKTTGYLISLLSMPRNIFDGILIEILIENKDDNDPKFGKCLETLCWAVHEYMSKLLHKYMNKVNSWSYHSIMKLKEISESMQFNPLFDVGSNVFGMMTLQLLFEDSHKTVLGQKLMHV